MKAFVYSYREDLLKEISKFLEEQKILVITNSEPKPSAQEEYSIFLLDFQGYEDYQEFLKNYSPSSSLVKLGIFPKKLEEEVLDICLVAPSFFEVKKSLKLASELALFRRMSLSETSQDSKFVIHQKSIYSLATSLSQGSGFGSAVSLVDMISATKQEFEKNYIVSKDLVDLLIKNNEFCRHLLDGLQQMVELLENEIPLKRISYSELVNAVPPLLKKLEPLFVEKGLKVNFQTFHSEFKLLANIEKILLVVEELLINAIKYSESNSEVELKVLEDEFVFISVKNMAHEKILMHLPNELKEFAREPFVRFYPPGEESLQTHRYGLGLGLTAIDYIVAQHNGEFSLQEEGKNFIIAQVKLPIVK